MREGNAEQATTVRKAIQKGGIDDIEAISAQAVRDCGGLEYTQGWLESSPKKPIRH